MNVTNPTKLLSWLILAIPAMWISIGCGTAPIEEAPIEDEGEIEFSSLSDYLPFVERMDDDTRIPFLQLTNNVDRQEMLAHSGTRIRANVATKLKLGMTRGEVRKAMGEPDPGDMTISPGLEMWTWDLFNGRSWTRVYVHFTDGLLVRWGDFNPHDLGVFYD
jgi:hypothetical protein